MDRLKNYLKAIEEGTTEEYHRKRGRCKMQEKQIELDKFDIPEPPKAETPAPNPDFPEPKNPKPSDRLSKKSEVCEMPRSAQFKQWVSEEDSCDVYWCVWFPSGRVQGLLYQIHIDKEDYIMTCNCPAFIGGIGDDGKPFTGKGVCSHVKRLRWTVSIRKGDPKAVSLAARLNLSEEWLDDRKIKILEAVKRKSMTCDELEVELGLKHQTCSAIICWLHNNGWLEDSGDTRPTRSGIKFQAIVWQIP